MKVPKKLVLYSGGQTNTNAPLHFGLVNMLGHKKRKRLTYVPFTKDGAKPFFDRFVKRYQKFGVTDFHCLPLDEPVGSKDLSKALNGDGIYLAGGNTFYFLQHLRRRKLLQPIKEFVASGKVLAGLSAGAIIMTPNIELAAFPPFDADENEVGLKNLKALNLVNFEFFPHFVNSRRMNEAMMMYSLLSKFPVFACADGSGIIINGEQKNFYGEVAVFFKGNKLRIDKWS